MNRKLKAELSRLETLESRMLLSATTQVIGFFPDYRYDPSLLSGMNWGALTQLNYFSVVPNNTGNLPGTGDNTSTSSTNPQPLSDLSSVVSAASSHGHVPVDIVVGGAGYAAPITSVIEGGSTTWNTFATSVQSFCNNYHLQGVDLDWEPAGPSQSDLDDFAGLIGTLHSKLSGLSISADVLASPVLGNEYILEKSTFADLATINVMDYDLSPGAGYSPVGASEQYLSSWGSYVSQNGGKQSQVTYGMPFFGEDNSGNAALYGDIIAGETQAFNSSSDVVTSTIDGATDTYNINSQNTIATKVKYALDNGYGGVVLWELGQDSYTPAPPTNPTMLQDNSESLLTAVQNEIQSYVPPTTGSTVIVDDPSATKVGTWTSGNSTSGFYGTDYLSDGNTGKGTKSVTYTPTLSAGNYQVFARWTSAASRATNVPFDVKNASGTQTVSENEQINGGKWVSLGTFPFNSGTSGSVTIRTTSTNGYVIADAVEFVPVSGTPTPPAAPGGLKVSNIQSTQVTLSWTESSTPISGFTIQRSTDDATWGNTLSLGNVASASITGLAANQTYYFRISASNSGATSGYTSIGPVTTAAGNTGPIIVDDTSAAKVGAWTSGNTTSGFYGTDYLSDGNTGKGTKSVSFTPDLPATGTYKVYARWTAASSRATNVPMDIVHQGMKTTVTVNEQQNGGVWFLLGTFTFDAGTDSSVTIRTTGTNGYVIADAVEFVPS